MHTSCFVAIANACTQGTRRRANRPKQTFSGAGSYTNEDSADGEEHLAAVGAHVLIPGILSPNQCSNQG